MASLAFSGNGGDVVDENSYTEWLYEEYVRPPIVDVAAGARRATGDLLKGTVYITGSAIEGAGSAAGYLTAKGIRGIGLFFKQGYNTVLNKPSKR